MYKRQYIDGRIREDDQMPIFKAEGIVVALAKKKRRKSCVMEGLYP